MEPASRHTIASSLAMALKTLAVLTLMPLPPARAGALEEIEARHARGEMDTATYHRLRVLAIRAPERLPPDLPTLAQATPRRSGTPILVEAFQWLFREGDSDDPLHTLLAPPGDLAYSLDSAVYPFRVLFDGEDAGAAAQVLEAAEESWRLQVDEWGWRPPLYEPALGPYRIYIGPTGSGVAGYAVPYGRNPDTPHTDCFTYVFISPHLGSYAPATVAHELNHAMQAATDCDEVIAYWENTAVYMEAATFPHLAQQSLYNMYAFQAVPWRSLDHFEYGQGYQYGGALWNYFLVDAFDSPATGPMMLRDIWEASMQEDLYNSVTYFDGIDDVLAQRVSDASPLESAFMDFCEARYFVGSRDDGAHIEGASRWWFAELVITERHTVFEMPLEDVSPPSTSQPAPFGSNHIRMDLPSGYKVPIAFRFQGLGDNRWAARVVAIGGSATTHVDLDIDPSTSWGEVVVPTEGLKELLLVVANLGPEGYSPGKSRRDGGDYLYSILPQIPAPIILAADPSTIEAGQQHVPLILIGQDIVWGRGFQVRFEDPSIQLVSVSGVTDTEILLRVTVPKSTAPGPKTVEVTNHGGATGVGVGVLTVTERKATPPPTGCGCQARGARTGSAQGATLGAILLFTLFWWWRRQRTGCTRF